MKLNTTAFEMESSSNISLLQQAIYMYVTLNTEADKWLTCFKGNPIVDRTFMYKLEGAVIANRKLQSYIKGRSEFDDAIDYFEQVGEIFSECMDKIRKEKNPKKQLELVLLMDQWRNEQVTTIKDGDSFMTREEVVDFVLHLTKGSALTKEIIINSYNTIKKS